MEQLSGFQQFDEEQSWKRLTRQRIARGITRLNLPETQDYVFSTDLDDEIDQLTRSFQGVISWQ